MKSVIDLVDFGMILERFTRIYIKQFCDSLFIYL